jgi:hypothetical protein
MLCDKIEKNGMGGAFTAVGEERGVYKNLVGKPEERKRDHWGDPGVDGRIILG